MGFFVPLEIDGAGKPKKRPADRKTHKRLDLEWLALGKKAGLSFDEINELRIEDLADYHDTLFAPPKEEQKERWATQEDIDRFYAT